jgi:ATP-dependent exoDNAse (exonuclease V) beta subunit
LHLLGQLAAPRDGEAAVPARGTLLDRLWPAIAASWPMTSGDACGDTAHSGSQHRWIRPRLRRLPDGWQPPALPPAWTIGQAVEASSEAAVLFDWASRWAMHAGSVVHRWLQHIAADGVQNYPPARIRELRPRLRSMLADAGVADGDCDRATSRVVDALSAAVSDARGAWLLSADRREASNELALTVAGEGRCRRIVIDRSFVCDDGWRWVIDYKTSSHEGTDIEAFIASEVERYRDQLQTYREAIAAIDPRPVRAALYFPLLGRFVEVPDSVS